MKLLKMRSACAAITIFFAVIALLFSIGMFVGTSRDDTHPVADSSSIAAKTYYYDQLVANGSSLEAKFYRAIKSMWENGDLKSGNASIDLVANGHLSQRDVDTYAANSMVLLYAFGAAKDAFYLDHPEVFYVDFDKLSVRTLTQGGKNYAFLGTGRADSYLFGGFADSAEVESKITEFGTKCSQIVAEVDDNLGVAEQIKAIYNYVRSEISYKSEITCTLGNEAFVRNPYGGIVLGEGVCEAYARSFKILMDMLDIPCISVIGMYHEYADASDPQKSTLSELHMWNYVEVNGFWYMVDTTMDSGKAEDDCQYFLAGFSEIGASHIPDEVISESNYPFQYPDLCNSPYSAAVLINANFSMTETSAGGTPLVRVTYKGMNGTQLYENLGLFFVANYSGNVEDNWAALTNYTTQLNFNTGACQDSDDGLLVAVQGDFSTLRIGVTEFTSASQVYVSSQDVIEYSDIYQNQYQVLSQHRPFPIIVTPSSSQILRSGVAYDVSMTFDENLVVSSGKSVSVEVSHNAGVVLDDIRVSDVSWDNARTVKCRFTTSSRYAANTCTYSLYVKGLVSAETGRECMPAGFFVLNQTNVGCPAKWGQTYEVYGSPQLLENGDIDTTDWQPKDFADPVNKKISYGVALVVSDYISENVQTSINAGIAADLDKTNQTVLATKTYDISLTLCAEQIKQLPYGKRVKIMLPFPEGYSGKETGVTFQAYHYNSNTGVVEEVDCLINENGVVIFCNEFSPFTVVATQKIEGDSTKKIFSLVHEGGCVDVDFSQLLPGDSQTFVLSPNSGYVIDFVRLNGQDKVILDNKLTVDYSDLDRDGSVLEVFFIKTSVKQAEEQDGFSQIIPTAATPSVTITRYVDTLSAVVKGVVGQLSYQWYMDGELIVGATAKDYAIEAQNSKSIYTVQVTNSVMNSTAVAMSAPYQQTPRNVALIVVLLCVGGALVLVVLATMLIRHKNAKKSDL